MLGLSRFRGDSFLRAFRKFSTTDSKAARESRRLRSKSADHGPQRFSFYKKPEFYAGATLVGIAAFSVHDIRSNKTGFLGSLFYGSSFERYLAWAYDETFGRFEDIFLPASDKLLPDWESAFYGNPAPGTPCPPLLVLDLERTLIGSVYDAKHGWRHVKRPGVDKFLEQLGQYYEIVLFSENDVGVSQDIFMAIDTDNRCHKFGADKAESRNGVMLKRLDLMNRDLSRVILIDDSEEASQLFPKNTIYVKPFVDVTDKRDRILLDLVPLLQAFVHNGVPDFRETIEDLGTNIAEEITVEYQMRVASKKAEEQSKRNKGLGGIIRGKTSVTSDSSDLSERSSILSVSQIVGSSPDSGAPSLKTGSSAERAPPPLKKKGALLQWMEESEKAKQEDEMRKQEKMNEIYMKRMREKAKKEQEEKEKEERRKYEQL